MSDNNEQKVLEQFGKSLDVMKQTKKSLDKTVVEATKAVGKLPNGGSKIMLNDCLNSIKKAIGNKDKESIKQTIEKLKRESLNLTNA